MFLKLVCSGSKIYIESIKIGFKMIHLLQTVKTCAFYSHPSYYVFKQGAVQTRVAGFQKVKVLKY